MPTVLAHSGAESDKSSVVECMDWQAAGNLLATGSMDGWIRVWSKSGLFAVAWDVCLGLPSAAALQNMAARQLVSLIVQNACPHAV